MRRDRIRPGESWEEFEKRRDDEHVENPRAGDYWDMGMSDGPLCGVIKVSEDGGVWVCRKWHKIADDRWRFYYKEIEYMERDEFRNWLSYARGGGCLAHVRPKTLGRVSRRLAVACDEARAKRKQNDIGGFVPAWNDKECYGLEHTERA